MRHPVPMLVLCQLQAIEPDDLSAARLIEHMDSVNRESSKLSMVVAECQGVREQTPAAMTGLEDLIQVYEAAARSAEDYLERCAVRLVAIYKSVNKARSKALRGEK